MLLLNSRAKALATILTTGAVSFGITTALLTFTSAQEAPSALTTSADSAVPSDQPNPQLVPEVPIGTVQTVTSGEDIAFPVDAYRTSPENRRLILQAEYEEMTSCMARYGLAFAASGPAWSVPATNHDYDRLFGLIDITEARAFGYHTGEELLASTESKTPATSETDAIGSQPYFLAVAMGDPSIPEVHGVKVPDGGCIAEARGKLADDHTAQRFYEETVNYGLAQSDADVRVTAAFGAWSACMERAGFFYANPMDAINDAQWATATPSATEIKAATSDVECKVATNLTGLRVAVAAAWQSRYIHDHAPQFEAMEAAVDQQLRTTKEILG